ncbi:hypothetical protein D4764_02G0002850 [Takifugu flavidus]|uniref:Uncharacterized protein n=1 Tax=Takifugu flavidus TaxID=433684 RepID=A0A5C6NIA2_9TELE|nr:hypothetical protein D4764_02G0002850 [Takifugu flavidus]
MAANANLTGLSRRHGVKVGAGSVLSVEEVALAVGQEIGHSSVKSASRMNRAVVLFVANVELANRLVETGITVGGQFVQETPLTQPAAQFTLSNVPPFISDEFLERELSRHGKLVSPIKKLLSGCRSPLLRHIVSHRRQNPPLLRSLWPRGPFRRQGVSGAEGGPTVPDGVEMQSKAEGKRSECVRVTEVSGARENVEMVVEVTGESGEAGKEMDPTGVAFEVLGGLGETGDGMTEISELGEAGEMGDMGQTGEQGVAVGEVGQGTGECGAPGMVAGELGEGGMSIGEVGVSTGKLGEGGAGTSEGSGGVSEWWPAPAKRRRKQKNIRKDSGDKEAGRLEDAAAATDSDQEYMSDTSELSNTVANSERDDLYPTRTIKTFLTETKEQRLTSPRLKKHMGKARKQLRELSNKSTSL